MTVGQIIEHVRRILMDTARPYMWSDGELVSYMNESIDELAGTACIITDSVTAAMCEIDIIAGIPHYALNERVIAVKRVSLKSDSTVLNMVTLRYLDANFGRWESVSGKPRCYYLDGNRAGISLFPNPIADDTLKMTVCRLPLADLSPDAQDVVPEIGLRYHNKLIPGVLARAYEKADAEVFNADGAGKFRQVWDKTIEECKRYVMETEFVNSTMTGAVV